MAVVDIKLSMAMAGIRVWLYVTWMQTLQTLRTAFSPTAPSYIKRASTDHYYIPRTDFFCVAFLGWELMSCFYQYFREGVHDMLHQ